MVPKILDFFPSHTTYAEPFGGGASMLMAKYPSPVEVYNDLNSDLVNFFRIIRDRDMFTEFHRLIEMTPYSREEYQYCMDEWQTETDPLKRAYLWYYIARTSFGGKFGASWGTAVTSSNRGISSTTSAWLATIEKLPQIHKRLMEVQIENVPYQKIIKRFDTDRTFFYCDPPYVPETRKAGVYKHEMTLEDHEELVDILLNIKGMALLSGYDAPVYAPLLEAGWVTKSFDVVCSVVGHTSQNGLKGTKIMLHDSEQKRTEVLYISPNALQDHRENLLVGMEFA